jgi:DNA-binding transcriptional LysR family regulator
VGIVLTVAGERLLEGIRPILASVAQLKSISSPAMVRKVEFEELRIGGSLSASAEMLPSRLARFRLTHPNVNLVLRTRTSVELERLVLDSKLDLAVSVRLPRSDALAYRFLALERVAMFVPSNHHLVKKDRLSLSDLLAEPLIIRGGKGSSGIVDKALRQIRDGGVLIRIAMQCDGPTAIKAGVREKMGVGMLYEDSIKAEVASGEFKILKIPGLELTAESYLIYLKSKSLSPLAQEFVKLLTIRGSERRNGVPTIPGKPGARSLRTLDHPA